MSPGEAGPATGGSNQTSRGRGNRGKGRGGRGGGQKSTRGGKGNNRGGRPDAPSGTPANPAAQDVAAAARAAIAEGANGVVPPAHKATQQVEGEDDSEEVCFICANPVAHHSIAPCNHKTCHICGLRMRALYKTKDCAHCRVSDLSCAPRADKATRC